MTEISITYCVPCRYQYKAIQDADAILKEFGQRLSDLRLVPGDHGVYNVAIDGRVVFSLDASEHFPETAELLAKLRTEIPTEKTGHRRA